MVVLEVIFWTCLACVVYTYIVYPLWIALRVKLRPAPPRREPFRGSFSIIVAAHNEEQTIGRRLTELCKHIETTGLTGEIIVVSDGSTDGTAAQVRAVESISPIRLIELPDNVGKAAALNVGYAAARGEILLFADARQSWADDAMPLLLENFADPRVGAVSGDLVLQTADGVMAGVGLYWRFEKWLRKHESLIHSQVSVTGAICAVRQELFHPIPQGTVLDDVYWPLRVAMHGYRVIHDDRANAFDRLPDKPRDEFRRKVRTLSGNFQVACRVPASLLPWRNPVWLAWLSHKLLRLAVPWALLGTFVTSALLDGFIYQLAFWGQSAGYLLALLGLVPAVGRRVKLLGAAGSFLVLNAAAWLGFWVWLSGRTSRSWKKVSYQAPEDTKQNACSIR